MFLNGSQRTIVMMKPPTMSLLLLFLLKTNQLDSSQKISIVLLVSRMKKRQMLK